MPLVLQREGRENRSFKKILSPLRLPVSPRPRRCFLNGQAAKGKRMFYKHDIVFSRNGLFALADQLNAWLPPHG
jgi:hypothetical protein